MNGIKAETSTKSVSQASKATQETMMSLTAAAEELVKAACAHVENTSQNLAKDTLESLKELTIKSSTSTEKSIDLMKETMVLNMSTVQELLMGNVDSVKKIDTKLDTLNDSLTSLKDELASLNQTLEKQAITHKLEWAVSNFDKISEPFTFYSYKLAGKTVDFTKSSSPTLIKQILLAFLRGEGYDINLKTLSRQNKDDGEKQFREMISKEIQAIIGQKPRIEAGAGRCVIYSL